MLPSTFADKRDENRRIHRRVTIIRYVETIGFRKISPPRKHTHTHTPNDDNISMRRDTIRIVPRQKFPRDTKHTDLWNTRESFTCEIFPRMK